MASSARVGARGVLGVAGGRVVVLGEVGLFVVAAGDVVQGGLVMTSGRGRRRVRAGTDLGGVGAIGTVSRPARGGRSAHDSRRLCELGRGGDGMYGGGGGWVPEPEPVPVPG